MAQSVYEDCVERSKSAIAGLGLVTDDGDSVTVDIGKLPTAKENLDTLPLVRLYTSNRMVVDRPFGSVDRDGHVKKYREYAMGVVIISKALKDRKKSLSWVLRFRQEIARLFGQSRPIATPELLHVKFYPDLPFNPRAFNMSYDYSVMVVKFCCVESGTG